VAKKIVRNNLIAGEVSKSLALHPETPQYQNGCEQIDGFDVGISGLIPARVPASIPRGSQLTSSQQWLYEAPIYASVKGGVALGFYANSPYAINSATGKAEISYTNIKNVQTIASSVEATIPIDFIQDMNAKIVSLDTRLTSQNTDNGSAYGKYSSGTVVRIPKKIFIVRAKFFSTLTNCYDAVAGNPSSSGISAIEVTNPTISGWAMRHKWQASGRTYYVGDYDKSLTITNETVNIKSNSSGGATCWGYSVGAVPSGEYASNVWLEGDFFGIGGSRFKSSVNKVSVELERLEIPAGTYSLASDMYLLGTVNSFTTGMSRYIVKTHRNNETKTEHFAVADIMGKYDQYADTYVFGIGTEANVVVSSGDYTTTPLAIATFGTKTSVTQMAKIFGFQGKTAIALDRRCGPAFFTEGSKNLFGFTKPALMGGIVGTGAGTYSSTTITRGSDGAAAATTVTTSATAPNPDIYGPAGTDMTSVPTSTPSTDPYYVTLDSDVRWFEMTYSGIIVGTVKSEYMLSNVQSPTTVSVSKISSIGTNETENYYSKLSCVLGGVVYFASNQGISSMRFSNESQSFIPNNISFYGTRIEGYRVTSIATHAIDSSIYFTAQKGSDVVLRKLNLTSGAITNPGIESQFLNSQTPLVAVSQYDNSASVIVMYGSPPVPYSLPISETTNFISTLRTTRFGMGIGSEVVINKLYFTGINIRKLQYKFSNQEDITANWTELQLFGSELATGFTGTREISVTGIYTEKNNGLAVDVKLYSNADSPLTDTDVASGVTSQTSGNINGRPELVSISVEMEI